MKINRKMLVGLLIVLFGAGVSAVGFATRQRGNAMQSLNILGLCIVGLGYYYMLRVKRQLKKKREDQNK
jgi:uncharacterized membrane protein YidH (DUF202 family)